MRSCVIYVSRLSFRSMALLYEELPGLNQAEKTNNSVSTLALGVPTPHTEGERRAVAAAAGEVRGPLPVLLPRHRLLLLGRRAGCWLPALTELHCHRLSGSPAARCMR